ncbi:MAG TPA: tail fiber protein [Allosphingosinicella sp.]|jgi:microcystin-dependent protein
MGQPFIGEIRMFAGNFAPAGWAFCNGASIPISENDALYTLLGTTYGGDGQESFNLPNLKGRIPMHMGTGPDGISYPQGQAAGTESETLSVQQIPSHNHPMLASTSGSAAAPTNALLTVPTSSQQGVQIYNNAVAPATQLHPQTIGASGGSQPHENTQPFLCVNFIISLYGVFPLQN